MYVKYKASRNINRFTAIDEYNDINNIAEKLRKDMVAEIVDSLSNSLISSEIGQTKQSHNDDGSITLSLELCIKEETE